MSKETGRVLENGEACVYVEFSQGKAIEFLIDTGFNGSLSLSNSLAVELGLEILGEEAIDEIGQHKVICPVMVAEVIWLGKKQFVEVIINDGEDVLLGTEMLRDSILRINYQNNRVTIRNRE